MLRYIFFAGLLQCTISQQYQQKVAPGVPPQNYQNYQPPPPPPQPGYQQAPQQQYQPPPPQQQQYQPPPPQQQQYQQPPPQQQPPQQQQQQHGHHDPQLLNPANIAQERDHIQEHMDVPIDTSKMSEQELQFHYFKMHDADNNNKLDGCELIKSLIHWHGEIDKNHKSYSDQQLELVLEKALNHTDVNKDGYIDYLEYKASNYMAKKAQKKNEQVLVQDEFKNVMVDTNDDSEGREINHTIVYKDEDLIQMVEGALKQTDLDNDGYITYAEFKSGTGS